MFVIQVHDLSSGKDIALTICESKDFLNVSLYWRNFLLMVECSEWKSCSKQCYLELTKDGVNIAKSKKF